MKVMNSSIVDTLVNELSSITWKIVCVIILAAIAGIIWKLIEKKILAFIADKAYERKQKKLQELEAEKNVKIERSNPSYEEWKAAKEAEQQSSN